jgi:periplasmic divalent cation tolerance protein
LSASHDLEVVLVLTTLAADADALTFARTLVEEHLAACVNVLPPMTSVYRWRGRIEEDQERQIVIKTARKQVPALEQRLRELHPYELPEFLVLATSGTYKADKVRLKPDTTYAGAKLPSPCPWPVGISGLWGRFAAIAHVLEHHREQGDDHDAERYK